MNGDVKLIVQIPEVKYTITLCRSLTVIMGNSGIGKTTLCEIISKYRSVLDRGIKSSIIKDLIKINSSNNSEVIVLTSNEINRLRRINNSIILIDEVVFAKLMKDDRNKYEKLLRYTTNYYVIISRNQLDLSRIPFSITELYTLETEPEYSTELKRFINVTKNVPYTIERRCNK